MLTLLQNNIINNETDRSRIFHPFLINNSICKVDSTMTELPIVKLKRRYKKIPMVGKKFGRLIVIEEAGYDKRDKPLWKCVCDCGRIKIILGESLRSGTTKSCGHHRVGGGSGGQSSHGMSKTPEYHAWASMLQRCRNPKSAEYYRYGGRGIIVCEEWYDFVAFYNDMGKRPNGLTLERIDNNKGYDKNNCVWTTRIKQARNRRLQNSNKTGAAGVSFCKQYQKYLVEITADHKTYFLGYHIDIADAIAARKAGEEKYWGSK